MLRDLTPADGAPRPLPMRPAQAQARAVAVTRAVAPLVGAALALGRAFEGCARWDVPAGARAASPYDECAEQLLASSRLLAECVRRAGGVIRARRGDAAVTNRDMASAAARTRGGDDAPSVVRIGVEARRAAVGRLLADEHALARGLRHAIVASDAHADDRTADCLREVLDEVRRQQGVLSGLLAGCRLR